MQSSVFAESWIAPEWLDFVESGNNPICNAAKTIFIRMFFLPEKLFLLQQMCVQKTLFYYGDEKKLINSTIQINWSDAIQFGFYCRPSQFKIHKNINSILTRDPGCVWMRLCIWAANFSGCRLCHSHVDSSIVQPVTIKPFLQTNKKDIQKIHFDLSMKTRA